MSNSQKVNPRLIFKIRMWLVFIFGLGFAGNIFLMFIVIKSSTPNTDTLLLALLCSACTVWGSYDLIAKNLKMIKDN